MPFVDSESTNTYNPRSPLQNPAGYNVQGTRPPTGPPQGPDPTKDSTGNAPWDATYGAEFDNYQNAYNNAKADIAYKQNSTNTQYGFLPDGSVDPNSTGSYMQMRQSQGLGLEHAQSAARSRGFGNTDGAAGRGEDQLRFQQEGETNNLLQNYKDTMHGYTQDGLNAFTDFNSNTLGAKERLIARLTAAQQGTPPGAPPPAATPQVAKAAAALRTKGFDPWAINTIIKHSTKKAK